MAATQALAGRSPRGSPSARRVGSSAGSLGRRALALLRAHPVVAVGTVLVCLAAGAVAWNALASQTKRHPAPLFGAKPQATARVAAPPKPLPLPSAPAKTAREAPAEVTRSIEPAPRPAPARAAAAAPRDPIGEAIRLNEPPPPAPKPEAARGVAAAQKALLKLGYGPVKPDGAMGPATRQALERFERDRRLPVTGELGARTARELGAQSGLPVEP